MIDLEQECTPIAHIMLLPPPRELGTLSLQSLDQLGHPRTPDLFADSGTKLGDHALCVIFPVH